MKNNNHRDLKFLFEFLLKSIRHNLTPIMSILRAHLWNYVIDNVIINTIAATNQCFPASEVRELNE